MAGQVIKEKSLSDKKSELAEVGRCEEAWIQAKNVCAALNRLEENGILLPEPIIPLVRHFATCENCKSEFAYMHKRCSFVLQECSHKVGFASAKGCVHISEEQGEGEQ